MDKQQEYVLRAIEERDISFIRLWFTDVSGQLKSVAIAPAEVESAFEEGIGFDGSAIEGLTRVFESDMLLAPDPSTFQMLPWRDGDNGVARMFCDVLTPDGEPARTDPRSVLERQLARVAAAGGRRMSPAELGMAPWQVDRARASWRTFMARAATMATGSVPVATAWRRAVMAAGVLPAAAASATVKPVASMRPA